jgi:hypothetical protein
VPFTIFFTESYYTPITHQAYKVSLTASFLVPKVRQKIICEKLKVYKNSQNVSKIEKTLNYLTKKVPNHENRWKNVLFIINYVVFQKFIKSTKEFLGQNKKNRCLMILNDKLNCKISTIFM